MSNDTRLCTIEGCEREQRSREWCSKHYMRWYKHGDPNATMRTPAGTYSVCVVDGCGRKHYSHGWCNMHYNRWRAHGDPEVNLMPNRVRGASLEARFWAKVNKTETCWVWTARIGEHGYGEFNIDGKSNLAHRVSYQLAGGEIPKGMCIDHLCRVRKCIRPSHLEVVTYKENTRRGDSWKINGLKTHCPYDHEYTPENTYTRNGSRFCKACDRRRGAEYRARKKAKRMTEDKDA